MKVSELEGAQLDYWVARALGYQTDITKIKPGGDWCAIELRQSASVAAPDLTSDPGDTACAIEMVPNAIREFPACILGQKIGRGKIPYRASWFYPSTVWDHGGPIIDREGISLMRLTIASPHEWSANFDIWWNSGEQDNPHTGPTPLIAAMRAFVTSKYGEEVPDEG